MVRITESKSAAAVLKYFLESLSQEEFKELRVVKEPGLWLGSLATRLGLKGVVTREAFAALLMNVHPHTEEPLTPRMKEGRRTGYEVEVSAPKTLSLMYSLTNDLALLRVFVEAVRELAALVEEQAKTRVRRNGADEDRDTKEVAIAAFLHRTARPVGGIADPQIHAHLFIHNATWDPEENRVKALQFGDAYAVVPLLETRFMSILAQKVMDLGYTIRPKGRFWEIDGIPDSIVNKFSNRTAQIARAAAERGLTDPRDLDALGALTRERKIPHLSLGDLKAAWASRLTHAEQSALFAVKDSATRRRQAAGADAAGHNVVNPERERVRLDGTDEARRHKSRDTQNPNDGASHSERSGPKPSADSGAKQDERDSSRNGVDDEQGERSPPPLSPADQRKLADTIRREAGKIFERRAVVPETVMLDAGLRASHGRIKIQHVRDELASQGIITRVINGRALLTTREAVADETLLVQLAVSGKGRYLHSATTQWRYPRGLSEEQAAALRTVLSSSDLVTIVQGRAGVGKTRLTSETAQQIVDGLGRSVCMLAPTAQAARGVLRSEGHRYADTVAKFLGSDSLQARARGGVIWVDEAGLLSTKDTIALLQKAAALGSRVVLMGDSHQNKSVSRGNVLMSLEEHARARMVSVEGVQRQRGAYKDLVEKLNQRDVAGALAGLDAMQALRTVPKNKLFTELAADFVASRAGGKQVLLVAPTHNESREATLEIRRLLRESGQLRGRAMHETLVSRGLTEFERLDAKSYQPGDVVCFHRTVGSPTRGTFEARSRWEVLTTDPLGNVIAKRSGLTLPQALPLKSASAFDVFEKRPAEFAAGDTVRITSSAKLHSRLDWALKLAMPSRQKPTHDIDRGAIRTIAKISPRGRITLDNGLVLPPDFGHLTHGYCLTSFAAQGMTADVVLGVMSTMSGLAASFRQFYVTVTRGREAVRIYTDDRESLVAAVSRREDGDSALNLLEKGVDRKQYDASQREWSRQQARFAEQARRAEEAAADRDRRREQGRSL